VAPRAGAWIETPSLSASRLAVGMSLPVRERGLKSALFIFYPNLFKN
ncbi:hypothetical protein SAMN02745728_01754, partial [Desulfovibrio litoralis DSM 11393]